jgi:hypothetical protein
MRLDSSGDLFCALGQDGIASTEAFLRVFHGRHPEAGELLGRPHGEHGVPAFDMVLRPAKSVSLLYGLGDAQVAAQVLDAHHQATSEALSYLEEHVGARRGRGGHEHVTATGCWRSASTTAPAAPATRCCTPM